MRDWWLTSASILLITLEMPINLRQIWSIWEFHFRFSCKVIPRYLNEETRLITLLSIDKWKLTVQFYYCHQFICQFFFSHIWFFVCVCFFQIRFIAMSAVTKTIYLIKKMRLSNSIVLFSWQKKAIPSRKVAELFSSNHRLIQNVAQLLFCCFFFVKQKFLVYGYRAVFDEEHMRKSIICMQTVISSTCLTWRFS